MRRAWGVAAVAILLVAAVIASLLWGSPQPPLLGFPGEVAALMTMTFGGILALFVGGYSTVRTSDVDGDRPPT